MGGGGCADGRPMATPADLLGDTRQSAEEGMGRKREYVGGEGRPCFRHLGALGGVVTAGG